MFHGTKTEVIAVLEKMRQERCAYRGSPRHLHCDCKFGYSAASGAPRGEVTGCPELRSAISVLEQMTDQEYKQLVHRSDGVITGGARSLSSPSTTSAS